MQDSRLNQIEALVDDARGLVVDIRDEGEGLPAEERILLAGIQRSLNAAIVHTQNLKKATR